MPKVIVPSVNLITTPETGAPRAVDSDAFGGIAARQTQATSTALQSFGAEMVDIAAQMQDQEDTQKVLDADAAFKNFALENARAAEQTVGADARGLATKSTESLAKFRDEIAGKLSPRQRLAFLNKSDSTTAHFTDKIARHEAAQNRKALEDSTIASLSADISTSAANPLDVALHARTVANIRQAAEILGKQNGWTPEVKAEWIKANDTKLHTEVIENLANGSGGGPVAKAYFEANKKNIDGTKHDQIMKMLKTSVARDVGLQFVDSVQGQVARLEENTFESGADALRRELREKLKDPAERDYAERELNQRLTERMRQIKDVQRQASDAAYKIYEGSKDFKQIPPSVLEAMDPKERHVLRKMADVEARGTTVKTDQAVFAELYHMSDPNNAAKFAEFQQIDIPRRYGDKLSPSDIQELVKRQQRNPKTSPNAASIEQLMNNAVGQMGLSTSSDKERIATFKQTLFEKVRLEEERKGKPLVQKEIEDIIKRETAVVSNKWYQFGTRRVFEAQPGDADFTVEVPEQARANVDAALKKRGLPLNDRWRSILYKTSIGIPLSDADKKLLSDASKPAQR